MAPCWRSTFSSLDPSPSTLVFTPSSFVSSRVKEARVKEARVKSASSRQFEEVSINQERTLPRIFLISSS